MGDDSRSIQGAQRWYSGACWRSYPGRVPLLSGAQKKAGPLPQNRDGELGSHALASLERVVEALLGGIAAALPIKAYLASARPLTFHSRERPFFPNDPKEATKGIDFLLNMAHYS